MKKKTMLKAMIIAGGIFLAIVEAFLLFGTEQKVAVLTYHNFATPEERKNFQSDAGMITDTKHFEEQMKFLKDNHFKTLTMEEFKCWKEHKCRIPRRSVLITMDDGFLSNAVYAFPILEKYNLNASVFYNGAFLSQVDKKWTGNIYDFLSLNQIKMLKEEYPNVKFYSHSYDLHHEGSLDQMNEKQINQDFEHFEQQEKDKYFAYPFGKYNNKIIHVLKRRDYKLAFTFGPDNHRKATQKDDDYLIPRLNTSGNIDLNKFALRLMMPF